MYMLSNSECFFFFFSRYLLMTNKKIIIFRKLMHFMDSTRFEIIEMVFFIQKYLVGLTSLNGFVLFCFGIVEVRNK